MTANLHVDQLNCEYEIWEMDSYIADALILNADDVENFDDYELEVWFRTLEFIKDETNNNEILISRRPERNKVYINFNFEQVA